MERLEVSVPPFSLSQEAHATPKNNKNPTPNKLNSFFITFRFLWFVEIPARLVGETHRQVAVKWYIRDFVSPVLYRRR